MTLRFSQRTAWDLTPNAFHQAKLKLDHGGVPLIDLTLSNPTQCDFDYPHDLLQELADPQGLLYAPESKGRLETRQCVSQIYKSKGVEIPPEQILLTASTSEAYGQLFTLLTDPGDEVLIPQPSYPLFGYLAQLNNVNPLAYPLYYSGRWQVDVDVLECMITSRTRAIIVVHPNNPTGSLIDRKTAQQLYELCRKRNLALISDEVFAEYCSSPTVEADKTLLKAGEATIFSLGGASKFLGLPQMKLGWIAATGPKAVVEDAMARLEVIADTYLSVSTPVQLAWPHWVRFAESIQGQVLSRIDTHREMLQELSHQTRAFELMQSDGGWYAVLRSPMWKDEEKFILKVLADFHVLVHPGYFFDFHQNGILVVSLLLPTEKWWEGIRRIVLEKRSSPC